MCMHQTHFHSIIIREMDFRAFSMYKDNSLVSIITPCVLLGMLSVEHQYDGVVYSAICFHTKHICRQGERMNG